MFIIPDKNRSEWKELLSGQRKISCHNVFLQMKINQIKNLLEASHVTMDEALDEFYTLCTQFIDAPGVEDDIKRIFNLPSQEPGSEIKSLHKEAMNSEKTKKTSNELLPDQNSVVNGEQISREKVKAKSADKSTSKPKRQKNGKSIDSIKHETEKAVMQRLKLMLEKEKRKSKNQTIGQKRAQIHKKNFIDSIIDTFMGTDDLF